MPLLAAVSVYAADVVEVASGEDGRGRTKLTGEILDFTGERLTIRLEGGGDREVPAEKIAAIETALTPEHRAADEAFARRDFAAAHGQYKTALERESRAWMRRRIVAQLVWTCRAVGDTVAAGDFFLLLARSDPTTLFFDAIPLAWRSELPDAAVERQALAWLEQESSAAGLVGASFLLGTPHSARALERLKQLAQDKDPRIAGLAKGQSWRQSLAGASDAQIASWRQTIERLPEELRAGPHYVLGRALAQRGEHEAAALTLLRVPILYPRETELAASALLEAGRALERLDQREEAAGLYREVLGEWPDDSAATEAAARLETLQDAER